jgi:2-iminobutanoate/2-iminopropanoate deaminase
MRELIVPKAFPAPKFRYSPVVRTGPFYEVSGMIGLDPVTGRLVEGGPEAETARILATLGNGLAELGLGWGSLVSARIFTTRFEDFPAINRAWESVFTADVPPPARTAVGVVALPLNATVEMEFRLYTVEG